MKVSNIEKEYWDALERLKSGKSKIVDTRSTRFKFTKDAVGREAGRGKGYVRHQRYPELCLAISDAETCRQQNSPATPSATAKIEQQKALKNKARDDYSRLKDEYDLLMIEYLNVVRRNFELETGLVDSTNVNLIRLPNAR
ncbi:Uncharacterised protein [Zhongshania aliphaticivorans]|uniref:Uncharacterized protein n=1 Tax=Zhongshania aliphaticivorans TaxID=1470434 RepID=A0A5S9NZX4_9GAMM|nr:hypothetical protein [Zhongshania aliphaticivorans]CAA0089556.1 Uncharacterised protein [Zhongshania aliphaticivorans]CAA0096411.1 Uncharacterised protein [Zhongshania aliphaticivorans]